MDTKDEKYIIVGKNCKQCEYYNECRACITLNECAVKMPRKAFATVI